MPHRRSSLLALALTALPLSLAGCSAAGGTGSQTHNNGSGASTSSGGTTSLIPPGGGSTSQPSLGGGVGMETPPADSCGQTLPVVFRDFKGNGETGGHPDFEASARGIKNSDGSVFKGWNDIGCGLVQPMLGADSKPVAFTGTPDQAPGTNVPMGVGLQRRVVSGAGCYPATSGICGIGICKQWDITPITWSIMSATTFNQWYNTTPNVNMEIPGQLALTLDPATGDSVYDTTAFFPIDGQGFGTTPGQQHNYHFTTEIHVKFKYEALQKFTFRGDDDLWIFVNGKLALDVGGQHQALEGTIDFDAQAGALGITAGSSYPMDIFHAERQTTESNFRIQTNIKCFETKVK